VIVRGCANLKCVNYYKNSQRHDYIKLVELCFDSIGSVAYLKTLKKLYGDII
jgi:hypothetical protein